tara:strand:+ start:275 stop:433 length:159 start_codon:yes stop_codon:yes gene_type:complete
LLVDQVVVEVELVVLQEQEIHLQQIHHKEIQVEQEVQYQEVIMVAVVVELLQ